MPDKCADQTRLPHGISPKNAILFGAIWIGQGLVALALAKWVFHAKPSIYFLLIPWALYGFVMVRFSKYFQRMSRVLDEKVERDLERMDKWTPPGFP
jgi:hypothetical protein